jgi:hypothetical protein
VVSNNQQMSCLGCPCKSFTVTRMDQKHEAFNKWTRFKIRCIYVTIIYHKWKCCRRAKNISARPKYRSEQCDGTKCSAVGFPQYICKA